MTTRAHVTIRFIRDESKTDGSTDDVAYIYKNKRSAEGRIEYHSGNFTYTTPLEISVIFNSWLPMVFDMLLADDDPYVAIQLDTPFVPTVFVRVASLRANSERQPRLMRIIEFALQHDAICQKRTPPPVETSTGPLLSQSQSQSQSQPPPVVRPVSPTLQSSATTPPRPVLLNLVPTVPATHRTQQPFASPLGLPSSLHIPIHLPAPNLTQPPSSPLHVEEPVIKEEADAEATGDAPV